MYTVIRPLNNHNGDIITNFFLGYPKNYDIVREIIVSFHVYNES